MPANSATPILDHLLKTGKAVHVPGHDKFKIVVAQKPLRRVYDFFWGLGGCYIHDREDGQPGKCLWKANVAWASRRKLTKYSQKIVFQKGIVDMDGDETETGTENQDMTLEILLKPTQWMKLWKA